MEISIVGAGYVGLVTGACLAERGHAVHCVDRDERKLALLRQGQSPIYEPGLELLLARHLGRRLQVTSDLTNAVASTELTMIAVGTPFDGTAIDLTHVRDASHEIGAALAQVDRYHLVVIKSTVVPGTSDHVVRPILERASGKVLGEAFGLGTNPEFLSEGTAVRDFLEPDRIVIGGSDARAREVLCRLYEPFENVPRVLTTNQAAEMIKYASNSLLACLISFSNEIGNLCAALGGIDARDVFRGVHLSQYLSPQSPDGERRTAPIAAFLEPGCGFGGSCLPKDVQALIRHGQGVGQAMPLLEAVMSVNREQPARLLELLNRHFPELSGLRTTVLGLAFKPDTDDVRESPALPVVRTLLAQGADVRAYDPIANENFSRALADDRLRYCRSLEEAVRDAQAVLLITRWCEFEQLPELMAETCPQAVLIDGRRMIPRHRVTRYEGIGVG